MLSLKCIICQRKPIFMNIFGSVIDILYFHVHIQLASDKLKHVIDQRESLER